MTRLTRKVFNDLAIWMIGFGTLIGIIFPFFIALMGVPVEMVIRPWFFGVCISAGIVVGAVNIALARVVIGRRLRVLSQRMGLVEANLREAAQCRTLSEGSPEESFVHVDSDDELGQSAQAFNHLVEALRISQKTEAAVRDFNEVLAGKLELEEFAKAALDQLMHHSEASAGAILIETEGELSAIASHGIRSADQLALSDHVHRALRQENRQLITMPHDVTIQETLIDFRPRQMIVDTLTHKGVPLGAVVLASPADFSEEVKARLDLFLQVLSMALNNALAHDNLQRLAAIDPLTGIYNRRFGLARLREEFGRAVRQNAPLGVLMFDFDHFKSINDTYGHLMGDRILSRMAKLFRMATREGDFLVRYGGEEFLSILPAASREDVRGVGERVRRIVEEASVVDGDQTVRVTISAGGTAYPECDAKAEEELVRQADQALYSAKESGRNRVVVI